MTTTSVPRRRFLVGLGALTVLGVLALVALGRLVGSGGTDSAEASGAPAGQVTASDPADVPSALDYPADPDLPPPAIDITEITPVLGPDSIPAIDEPRFQAASTVDWLEAREPIISVTVNGETRGYPVQIMTWHEIVNDSVGGEPVAVTYCPLCNSSLTFQRTVDGGVLDFGTSGMLRNNNLVMYDRQTESLWQQAESRAIAGVLVNTELERVSAPILSWQDFLAANPDAPVLTRDTGASRAYGVNPYEFYDSNDYLAAEDKRLAAMTRVAGLGSGEAAVAVVAEWLIQNGRTTEVDVGGRPATVWLVGDTASALDTEAIAEGRAIGSIVAFDPRVDGRTLTFVATADGARDEQTASTWDLTGTATAGPLSGASLAPVPVQDTFWFAWSGFEPATTVVGDPTAS